MWLVLLVLVFRNLYVHNNQLSGSIPPTLPSLVNLTYVKSGDEFGRRCFGFVQEVLTVLSGLGVGMLLAGTSMRTRIGYRDPSRRPCQQ